MRRISLTIVLALSVLITEGCSGMRRSSEADSDTYSMETTPIDGDSVQSEPILNSEASSSDIYGPEIPPAEDAQLEEQQPEVKESKPRLCLVLGPGFARGIAHAGVIEALVKNQIPIHCIVGVEMGAVVGAFYATTGSVNTMQWQLFKLNKDNLFNFPMITFGAKRSSGKEFHKFLKETVENLRVEQLKVKFAAVATQPAAAQPLLLSDGSVADALSASVALPGVFDPWKLQDGRKLLGGGVSSPAPVELARKLGGTFIVLVSVLPEPGEAAGHSDELFEKAFVPVLNLSHLQERGADVLIKPELHEAAYDDFSQLGVLVAAGREKTNELMEEIKSAWQRSQDEHKARAE